MHADMASSYLLPVTNSSASECISGFSKSPRCFERPLSYLPVQLGEDKSDYKPAEALQTIAEVHVLVGKEDLTREYEELPRSCH